MSRESLHPNLPRSARKVFRWLEKLPHGRLAIKLPHGETLSFGQDDTLRATWHIHDWRVIERTLRSGDIGFAESYRDGDWSSPELVDLLRLFLVNRSALEKLIHGTWWGVILYRLKHWLNRNSKAGSASNIHAHYDLGNDFYALWLDEDFNYSSAWFNGNFAQSLREAQNAKLRRALDSLNLVAGNEVLELGCGWGALAAVAIPNYGVKVTGLTLSKAQLQHAQQRMAQGGWAAQADLRLMDYRDVAANRQTPFDAIVSIEMFEAVGKAYWPDYFNVIKTCLKKGGRATIQTIVIHDDLYAQYQQGTDFIQHFIFPGGFLPSPTAFVAAAAQAGLRVVDSLAMGADYAETLKRWRIAFLAQEPNVRALGFDTPFLKIWAFYLAYCEAAFAEGNTNVLQYTLMHHD